MRRVWEQVGRMCGWRAVDLLRRDGEEVSESKGCGVGTEVLDGEDEEKDGIEDGAIVVGREVYGC